VVAVLDDEPEMRKAFRRLLTSCHFVVDEYESGAAFLATLPSHRPDCLLLDLQMPGVNGIGVLEACQCQHLHVPIVVVTAHDEPGTAAQVGALGASAYLKKPVDQNVLVSAIEAAISSTRDDFNQPCG
jgi:FixJ family two-component response regulator